MALSWSTVFAAMTLLPAIGGKGKHAHLQLVPPPSPSVPPPMPAPAAALPPPLPTAKKAAPLLPKEAAALFVSNMLRELGGNDYSFPVITEAYADMAKLHGWPSVSPKALSQALTAGGCTIEDGKRGKDGRRLKNVFLGKRRKSAARKAA